MLFCQTHKIQRSFPLSLPDCYWLLLISAISPNATATICSSLLLISSLYVPCSGVPCRWYCANFALASGNFRDSLHWFHELGETHPENPLVSLGLGASYSQLVRFSSFFSFNTFFFLVFFCIFERTNKSPPFYLLLSS